jgi:hypothetical protein
MAEKTRSKTRPGTFQKGNKAAVGNKGGGRPPEWLKSKCQSAVENKDLIQFLEDVAAGKAVREIQVGDDAVTIKAPAEMKDRLKALEMLMDRGWGKPGQSVEVNGNLSHDINEFAERG